MHAHASCSWACRCRRSRATSRSSMLQTITETGQLTDFAGGDGGVLRLSDRPSPRFLLGIPQVHEPAPSAARALVSAGTGARATTVLRRVEGRPAADIAADGTAAAWQELGRYRLCRVGRWKES